MLRSSIFLFNSIQNAEKANVFSHHHTEDHSCPLSFCRMAIQVDKFDFESLPQPREETVPYGNQKQLEEQRQHAQGYQINSKLGLCWSIISFCSHCVL